jgi:hypothetical protein
MKQIIIIFALAFGSLAGNAVAAEPEINNLVSPKRKAPRFVELSEEQQNTSSKETIRIKVDYIVDESGKNYVLFIQSNRPEINERIIRMVENMPVEPGTEGRKNNVVIEYQL